MKLFLMLITAFLVTGCSVDLNDSSYKPSDKQKLANEIRFKVATKLKKEKDLQPCGSGGQMMYEIKMLALSFFYYKPIDIDEGRELLIVAVNEFVDAVNADERIRPYLFNYPFNSKNIQIRIVVKNPDGSSLNNGELCLMSAIGNTLEYLIRKSEDSLLETAYEETFDEAVQKIGKESVKEDKGLVLKSA